MAGAAGYLLDALHLGGVAILIATPAHRVAFESQFAAAGVDVESVLSKGTLVSLDARKTMAAFLADGKIDPDRFDEVVGGLVERAVQVGEPVHAYGEMVDLLWDEGQIALAMELETLWNELGQKLPFSLYCSYRVDLSNEHEFPGQLLGVCSLHSAVIGSPGPGWNRSAADSRTFAADARSPRLARRFVVERLESWAYHELVNDAAVVVTELATNAVLHADSAFTVALLALPDGVRISLLDAAPAWSKRAAPTATSTSGRGLDLVAGLARCWGIEALPDGKLVWAELTGTGPHLVP
jgi:hypothetical protein